MKSFPLLTSYFLNSIFLAHSLLAHLPNSLSYSVLFLTVHIVGFGGTIIDAYHTPLSFWVGDQKPLFPWHGWHCSSGIELDSETKMNMQEISSGTPGWLSQLSVWFWLRSWSHGLWVRAPRWALCWQLRAWSLLWILCLPLSLPLPRLFSLSLSVSLSLSLSLPPLSLCLKNK